MKVLELLDELDEIIEVASGVPLVKKVMVDPDEVAEIVKEIREELPDEIQQAQWIKNERKKRSDSNFEEKKAERAAAGESFREAIAASTIDAAAECLMDAGVENIYFIVLAIGE